MCERRRGCDPGTLPDFKSAGIAMEKTCDNTLIERALKKCKAPLKDQTFGSMAEHPRPAVVQSRAAPDPDNLIRAEQSTDCAAA
jgi:hypothetical protein